MANNNSHVAENLLRSWCGAGPRNPVRKIPLDCRAAVGAKGQVLGSTHDLKPLQSCSAESSQGILRLFPLSSFEI